MLNPRTQSNDEIKRELNSQVNIDNKQLTYREADGVLESLHEQESVAPGRPRTRIRHIQMVPPRLGREVRPRLPRHNAPELRLGALELPVFHLQLLRIGHAAEKNRIPRPPHLPPPPPPLPRQTRTNGIGRGDRQLGRGGG